VLGFYSDLLLIFFENVVCEDVICCNFVPLIGLIVKLLNKLDMKIMRTLIVALQLIGGAANAWAQPHAAGYVRPHSEVEVEAKAEGIETDVKEMATVPVLIQSNNSTLRITGAEDGMPVSIYTISGQLLGTTVVRGNEATVSTNLHDGIAIVKMGNRAVKVLVK